ncbi:tetratricopeptide repeat protein [Thermogemmatispora sp.]|uniref:tetratricopeptide repeat protein n=1 Tax=Thermogemmatispora sp. TaxID=1968838 RepID=UPI002ACC2698|nr:tetratricopeptide repeat protein [Thermogemmatispora sp.]
MLRAYSLLSRDPQSGSLQVHRLVQAVLRDHLSRPEQLGWQQVVIAALLLAAPPGDDVQHWPLDEQWLPHARQAAAWVEAEPVLQTPIAAGLLDQVVRYLRAQGRYQAALPLAECSRSIRERVLGSDYPDTATALNTLALLYYTLGRLSDALPLAKRVLAIHERLLGPEHPMTQRSRDLVEQLRRQLGD